MLVGLRTSDGSNLAHVDNLHPTAWTLKESLAGGGLLGGRSDP